MQTRQDQATHRCGAQRPTLPRPVFAGVLWLALLALPGWAQAACGTMSVPDAHTTPTAHPMASGGTITIDASRCDAFGLNPYPNPGTSAPSHGSLTVNTVQGDITYVNNGDGVTSDSFVVEDASNNPITVNVAIAAATSAITISPGTLPDATVGVAYSQVLVANGGTAPYTWTLISGALPPLMTLGTDGTISGTTNSNGNFTFTVQATDNLGDSATKGYTIASPGPDIQITTNLPDPVRGIPYNQTMQAYPGTSPFTYDLDGTTLPAGLTLTSVGLLSGIPTGSGPTTFEIAAHDSSVDAGNGDNYSALRTYALTTLDPPALTLSPASLPAAKTGVFYSATVTASGGVAPYTYTLTSGALPAGLALDALSGEVSGTPKAGGNFQLTIDASDSNSTGASTGSRGYALTVADATISLAPATLPDATNGTFYSQTISASGGTAPYSYALTAGTLPANLSLSAAGVLSGTPNVSGSFNFTVSATDSSTGTGPFSQPRPYTLFIDSVSSLTLEVDDSRPFARYGQMLDYVVSVGNNGQGQTTGVAVVGNYSAGLYLPAASWQCFGGGSASVPTLPHCTPSSGVGALSATVDLPVGTGLTFLVSVPVANGAPGSDVSLQVDVSGGTDAANLSDSDSDTLVLFRDGFDVPDGDGTQRPVDRLNAMTAHGTGCARGSADWQPTWLFRLPPTAGGALIEGLLAARGADGSRILLQRLDLGAAVWLRLLTSGADGSQRASRWASTQTGADLALALADDGRQRWVLLEGSAPGLRLPLTRDAGHYTLGHACGRSSP